MKTVRLIREVRTPGSSGPQNGQYALQKALVAADIPWLKVGGALQQGEIPWIWSYLDIQLALAFDQFGWPFVMGPNVLFKDSHNPGGDEDERRILNASSCRMQFTESAWYAGLIQSHCNRNEAPITVWPYPIDPPPEGPLEPELDFLIYLKDMSLGREVLQSRKHWPKSSLMVYGYYKRDDLIACARRAKCCLYLSTDDRGPLAAAEIALAGCPLVGIERGCPWVEYDMGVEIAHFGTPGLWSDCEDAMRMDRNRVRKTALNFFSPEQTVATIRSALEPIARG